jgi:hypothetical protein
MGGKGAVKNPNARAIKTQKQREKRVAERVLKQLLKLSSSNTTEKLQKVAEPVLDAQTEDQSSSYAVKEFITDELPLVLQELDEESILAEILAAERSKINKGMQNLQKKKKPVQKRKMSVKVKNVQKPIAVEFTATRERIEILARELPGEMVYVPLDPRLADKVEKEEDMQKFPRNALLNRFMGNKFVGKDYDDEIHYGIVVEYRPLLDQYLVAYDDRTYNSVSWASLCRYIIKVGHMEKPTMDLLKTCLETEDYKTYNKFT